MKSLSGALVRKWSSGDLSHCKVSHSSCNNVRSSLQTSKKIILMTVRFWHCVCLLLKINRCYLLRQSEVYRKISRKDRVLICPLTDVSARINI